MKSPFTVPPHKVFEYQFLYYNPEKERIKQRRKELGLDTSDPAKAGTGGLLRSGAMRSSHDRFMQQMEDDSRRQKVRTLTLVIVFGLITYLCYNGTLDFMLEALSKK